ncbi:substrate-binding domain-containing protein, partial [Prochlorococcus sp. MIT 1303]|uniref:substrate-binding domain-containing protein n=1 Tax=Prochlorococcus sp. MIT 1303 TaxID=1723647 RepID=UPI0018D467C2
MTILKKGFLLSSLVALGVGITACSTSGTSGSSARLSGAGATFPAKIYTRWFSELAKAGGPQVNYQAVGSGSGRKAFIDQTVSFAASDDPMKQEDIDKVQR